MWPFKKNLDPMKLDDSKHKWAIAESNADSGPMLIRVNRSAKEWVGHPALGIRVGFAVPLNNPDPQGMPESSENEKLNQIEDTICDQMKDISPSIHVLAITTGTFKEFVFHIGDGSRIEEVHLKLQKAISTHEIQCIAENDPEWKVYGSFV